MLLKKLIFILAFICLFSFYVYSAEEPSLSAASAVLINADTYEVIYEKDAYKQRSMASTTKIMTAILAIESGKMSQIVAAEDIVAEGTAIGLKDGYKLSLEDLVWGMLLESGNDAAELTASFLSGSESAFAELMNAKAEELSMLSTNFVTASGLDSAEHYSTAYDMSLLGAYAVQNPIFRDICSTRHKTISLIEPEISLTFTNHNKLLSSCEGVFGIKTGFTKKSGRCLVSACERNGTTLVAVTLNAVDDWNDHIRLYEYGFETVKTEKIFLDLPENIKVFGGETDTVGIKLQTDWPTISYSGEKGSVTQKTFLPAFVYAPVKEGEVIGKTEIYRDGTRISSVNIIASGKVNCVEASENTTLFEKIINKIKDLFSMN